jgi:nitrite reductase/ring-hydroxylating ferredoxin subunit
LGVCDVHRLAALTDLVPLEPVLVDAGGRTVAVVLVGDEVYAFSPTCTHRAAPLVDGAVTWKHTVLCPWHLGTFSLRTGRAVAGPATRPLAVYPVAVRDGEVFLAAEEGTA